MALIDMHQRWVHMHCEIAKQLDIHKYWSCMPLYHVRTYKAAWSPDIINALLETGRNLNSSAMHKFVAAMNFISHWSDRHFNNLDQACNFRHNAQSIVDFLKNATRASIPPTTESDDACSPLYAKHLQVGEMPHTLWGNSPTCKCFAYSGEHASSQSPRGKAYVSYKAGEGWQLSDVQTRSFVIIHDVVEVYQL